MGFWTNTQLTDLQRQRHKTFTSTAALDRWKPIAGTLAVLNISGTETLKVRSIFNGWETL